MRISASDFYTYHRPSRCELRVYLRHRGEPEAPPGPFEEVMRRLGQRHEQAHLATLPDVVDLGAGPRPERERRTREAAARGAPAIYQAALRARAVLRGTACEILGDPDFLIREEEGYVVRDSKLSRRITEREHPEILRQLEVYGWLSERTLGAPPVRLEIHSGAGEIVALPYDGGRAALSLAEEILAVAGAGQEPFSPVGWSKCGDCGFRDRCWSRAEARRDVALVSGVDQGLALALREAGVETVDALLARFDAASLAALSRPWGQGAQRVGKRADSILRLAQALASGQAFWFGDPGLPDHPNYAMFDLEGLPPQLDELEKVYLWGLQVFGERPHAFLPAVAGFGRHGDRQGWEGFLANAATVLEEYGDLPFVHWHDYEKTRLDMYVQRFGDPERIAHRVRRNLLNLLPIARDAVALPLPSYSLKVVERYIGFRRTQAEYGGDWAMARYIEATELEDAGARREILDQILAYNREDLEATWAVLEWLRARRGARAARHNQEV